MAFSTILLTEEHDCHDHLHAEGETIRHLQCPNGGVIVCEPKMSSAGVCAQAIFLDRACRGCCEIESVEWNPARVLLCKKSTCWRCSRPHVKAAGDLIGI